MAGWQDAWPVIGGFACLVVAGSAGVGIDAAIRRSGAEKVDVGVRWSSAQLNGLDIEAGAVIEAFDAAAGQPTWIVPLLSDGQTVAASRFLPFEDQVRLSEVTLYQPARDNFPVPRDGERLVLVSRACGDPLPDECLFTEYGWRIEQAQSL